MKRRNGGFTLVELMVTIAIIAIVGTAIVGFVLTATGSYKKLSNDVDLQYESQLTINQIENFVIDSTKGINYEIITKNGGTENTATVADDMGVVADSVIRKNLVIYNTNCIYKLCWNKTEGKIYYSKYNITYDLNKNVVKTPESENVLMAEYVSDFKVKLGEDSAKNSVNITLDFLKNSKTYATAHNITLRNGVYMNSAPEKVYSATVVDSGSDFTDVFISPKEYTMSAGGSVTFSAYADSDQLFPYYKDISWTVSGNTSALTTVSNGILNVGADENSALITLNASPRSNPAKIVSANIKLKQVSAVTASCNKSTFYPGSTAQLSAVVSGQNLDTSNSEDQSVVWSIVSGGQYASIDSNGVLTAVNNVTTNVSVSVIATSAKKSSVKSTPITITISPLSLIVNGDKMNVTLFRGDSVSLSAGIAGISDTTGYSFRWTMDSQPEGKVYFSNGTATIVASNPSITVQSDLSYNSSFTVSIKVELLKGTAVVQAKTMTITIPTVGITFISSDGTYKSNISISKSLYSTTTVYYQIVGLRVQSGQLSWNSPFGVSVYNGSNNSVTFMPYFTGTYKIYCISQDYGYITLNATLL